MVSAFFLSSVTFVLSVGFCAHAEREFMSLFFLCFVLALSVPV